MRSVYNDRIRHRGLGSWENMFLSAGRHFLYPRSLETYENCQEISRCSSMDDAHTAAQKESLSVSVYIDSGSQLCRALFPFERYDVCFVAR